MYQNKLCTSKIEVMNNSVLIVSVFKKTLEKLSLVLFFHQNVFFPDDGEIYC